ENPSVIRPARELKEYVKVKLNPGETGEVVLYLPESAFSYYDMAAHDWKVDHVNYTIQIGASATDIKLEKSLSF
ncbi:MAG: fibronectin type III-like domain-contianing protein, partial [Prevotellaceae bacterium]|nr:fibronectin type III-like domain-contianing protein [Candidatus Colivivens caballi]